MLTYRYRDDISAEQQFESWESPANSRARSGMNVALRRFMLMTLIVASLLAVPALARAQVGDAPLAPELSGLGTLHMPVTTSVPRAQRFFDQGLRLLYAFNHPESIRAFREAARLDPGLAIAYWGQALALGPNLNAAMTADNATLALGRSAAPARLPRRLAIANGR